MYQVNPLLAKLLAKENLTVEHGNYHTAWFDVKNRVLGLPIWKDRGKDVYDLLVGHEVGHALYTPLEGLHDSNEEIKGCPRSYINVVEDIRIERLIREAYPGLIRSFKRGYKVLFDTELFGKDHDFATMKLIDKINLKSKLVDLIDVPFNDEELELFNESLNTKTFSDVCTVVKKILAYTKEQEDDNNEKPQQEDAQPTDGNSDDNNGHDDQEPDEIKSDSGSEEEDESEDESEEDESELDDESPAVDEDGEDTNESLEEDESEKEEGGNITPAAPIHDEHKEISETDELFRSNEKELLDVNEDGRQTLLLNDYNQAERDRMIVTYAKLKQYREQNRSRTHNHWKQTEATYNVRAKCASYMKDVKKAVQPAVREFEMKKAAYQWQRASTAKTGSINVDKLYSYKYDEDIFSRVTQMADAKSHGLMLLVDYSGSMHNVIGNVIQQTLHLITFCKSVNIPFSVHAFTTSYEKKQTRSGCMDSDDMSLIELINSDLNKKDFDEAVYNLTLRLVTAGIIDISSRGAILDNSKIRHLFNPREYMGACEEFGSTPLNQALMVMNDVVKKFVNRHQVQKLNFVTITDGDANRIYTSRNKTNAMETTPAFREGSAIRVEVGGKIIDTRTGKSMTTDLLNNIRKTYNVNTIGFFIASRSSDFNYRVVGIEMDKNPDTYVEFNGAKRQAAKEYKKNKCVEFKDVYGYNTYYMLKGGDNELDTAADEFNPLNTKSIGNDFKKFAKSKKTNKVLMQKVGAEVA